LPNGEIKRDKNGKKVRKRVFKSRHKSTNDKEVKDEEENSN